MQKTCGRCKEIKDLNEFHKCSSWKDGHQYTCKECLKSDKVKKLEKIPFGFKICTKCDILKPFSEFLKDKDCKFGLMAHCKDCKGNYTHEHSIKYKTRRHELYLKNKDGFKNNNLINKFGITLDKYNQMVEAQNGVCAICGKEEINKALAVDHNHKTGEVRGLLCGKCNKALGFLDENIQSFRIAINYLQKSS